MNSTLAKVFRRSLYILLLLLAIIVGLAAIFLNQLDLNDYRHELEQELSSAFEQPVQIGRSKLTFNKGIALRFRDLRIGPPDALLAEVPRLTATLRIAPLFDGRIILDRVEIDGPRLQLWLPILNRPKRGTTHRLADELGIRKLTIRDASLKIYQRLKTGSRQLLDLEKLQIELRGRQPNRTATLTISGQLEQARQPAKFLLNLNLPSSSTPAAWRNEKLNYQLQINNLSIPMPTVAGQQRPPIGGNLKVAVTGVPADGATVSATLTSSQGGEQLFNLSGRWNSSAEREVIKSLGGNLLSVPLSGEFYLLRQSQKQLLTGRLEATDITLTPQLLERWRIPEADKLQSGKLDRLALRLEKSWSAGQPMDGLPRIGAEITLSDLEWQEDNLRQLRDFSANLSLNQQTLEIKDGLLVAGQQPVFFSGQIKNLFSEPQLKLSIKLQAQLADLLRQIPLPADWKLSGTLPIGLQLHGPLQQPSFLLQADLTGAELALGSILQKPAAQKSSLHLEGLVDGKQIQLDRLELQLPGLLVTGNGYFSQAPKSAFFLLDIDPFNLSRLQPLSPLLKKLRMQGTLHLSLERGADGLKSSLQLVNVGAHLSNFIGDLNRTNGSIELDRQGLRFANLTTAVGASDFILSGQINDWHTAKLDLNLQSKQVRAHDLIFPNQQLQLYDLNGRLQIDRNGINFDAIKVRLEQETQVVVNGTLTDFRAPQVKLDIEAEKANIDQVIELFRGPHRVHDNKKKVARKPLIITARVKEGTIGNLHFRNAAGRIRDYRGIFSIYPLRFQSGPGSCLARIEFDRNRQGSLLKISGHAEDMDASALHQQIFKQRGLISGSLRGDFYLEGNPANNKFWHNAVGAISLQVREGTLRKFRSLARVFSLLNISQLFVGKLPDMDKEGMPFTLLEGSIRIADGRAGTEDLRIISEAMNMSLVGSQSLTEDSIDYTLGVMPLRTVDKVITSIPIAGWLLAGKNKALLTAYFKLEGSGESPEVTAVPISSVS
ncbi:MAG: AsmA family protein, partial [Deltaproteobacteria bacterium]|nr:AsmA family protein [Deltaproteobacteria bacterium]